MHRDGVSPAAGAPGTDRAASSGALATPATPAPVPLVVAEPHPASGIAEALRTHPVVGVRHPAVCERACGGILKHTSEQKGTGPGRSAGAPATPAVHPSFLEPEKPRRMMHRRHSLSPHHVLGARQDLTESACTAAAPDSILLHPGVRRGSAPERAHSVGFVPCVDQHAHASAEAASRIHSRPPSPAVPVGTAIRAAAGTAASTKAQVASVRSTPELRESAVLRQAPAPAPAPAPARRLMFAVSPVEVAERRRKSAETGDHKGAASGARRRMVASPAHTSASSSNGSDVFESDDEEDSDNSQTTMHESGSEEEEEEEGDRGRLLVSSPHLAKPRRRSPAPQLAEAASPSSPETEPPVSACAGEARAAEADDTPDPCTAWAILSAESEGSRSPQIWSPPGENTPVQRFSLSVPVTHATTSPQTASVMPLAVSAERLTERLAGPRVLSPEDESETAQERQPNSDSGATSDVSGGALSDDGDDVGLPAGGDLSTDAVVPIFPLTFRRQSDLVGSPPSVQLRQYRAAARVDQTCRRPGIRSAGSTPARPGSMAARRARSMAEDPEPRPHRAMSFSPRALTFAEGLHAPASVALCRDPPEAEHRA